jgi:hypothetical protein
MRWIVTALAGFGLLEVAFAVRDQSPENPYASCRAFAYETCSRLLSSSRSWSLALARVLQRLSI